MLHVALGAEDDRCSLLWKAHHLSEECIHLSTGALAFRPHGGQRSSPISLCGMYFNKPSHYGK